MKAIPNSFTTYKLSEDEQRQGFNLTSLTTAILQNLRSQIAEEKLNLVFTPNDVLTFTQQEAHLKGQLDVLNYLLASAEESQNYNSIERK
jgi:hypothetical protein